MLHMKDYSENMVQQRVKCKLFKPYFPIGAIGDGQRGRDGTDTEDSTEMDREGGGGS